MDKYGIRYAAPFVYLELSMLISGLGYSAGLARLTRLERACEPSSAPRRLRSGLATFGRTASSWLALQRASAASVAAVRETSIVIAAAFAALVLKEQVGPGRLVGAIFVAGGVALLSF